MQVSPIIGERLRSIWSNPDFKHLRKHGYLHPESIHENALLFIGINPAFSENDLVYTEYGLPQQGNTVPYFKKFEEIASYCQTEWTHLDLFYFRETDQSKIHEILRTDKGVSFLWEQLALTSELIRAARPQAIIVANALAATFLGRDKQAAQDNQPAKNVWLDYDFQFDDDLGTYRWEGIPVFFSSMLSGQRALDKGSFERLQWHVRRSLTA